jgi:hypothetical protein
MSKRTTQKSSSQASKLQKMSNDSVEVLSQADDSSDSSISGHFVGSPLSATPKKLTSSSTSSSVSTPKKPTSSSTPSSSVSTPKKSSQDTTKSLLEHVQENKQKLKIPQNIKNDVMVDDETSRSDDSDWRQMVINAFDDSVDYTEDVNSISTEVLYENLVESHNGKFSSHAALKERIHELLEKYEGCFQQIHPDFKLQDIKSKGYKKLMEISHQSCCLLDYFRSLKEFDLKVVLEITELISLLSQLSMVFIREGIDNNSFEPAEDFLNPFLTSNNILHVTEKLRQQSRKDHQQKQEKELLNSFTRTRGSFQRGRGRRGSYSNYGRGGYNSSYNNSYPNNYNYNNNNNNNNSNTGSSYQNQNPNRFYKRGAGSGQGYQSHTQGGTGSGTPTI